MSTWLDVVVQGLLNGGMFALFALGLSISYGVMRIINVAQGDFIVLAGYLSLVVGGSLHLNPWMSLIPVTVLMFAIGYGIQRLLINRVAGGNPLPAFLITFGLSIIIQNGLLIGFSADTQSLHLGGISTDTIGLGPIYVGVLPLMALGAAMASAAVVNQLFNRTRAGLALRATSDNQKVASLMGIRGAHAYALALGIALALDAVAGTFAGLRNSFTPFLGSSMLLTAFEAVVIGGPGSIWGTVMGAEALGVAQVLGAQIDPGLSVLAGHLLFFATLMLRPQGLFPKTR